MFEHDWAENVWKHATPHRRAFVGPACREGWSRIIQLQNLHTLPFIYPVLICLVLMIGHESLPENHIKSRFWLMPNLAQVLWHLPWPGGSCSWGGVVTSSGYSTAGGLVYSQSSWESDVWFSSFLVGGRLQITWYYMLDEKLSDGLKPPTSFSGCHDNFVRRGTPYQSGAHQKIMRFHQGWWKPLVEIPS